MATAAVHSLLALLQNPVYAGAYAYGRTRTQVHLAQGRKQVSRTKRRAPADWRVLIADHHEGYIGWDEYRRIQTQLAHNAVGRGGAVRGAVRSGRALLVGLCCAVDTVVASCTWSTRARGIPAMPT
jgi:hypothetical protein